MLNQLKIKLSNTIYWMGNIVFLYFVNYQFLIDHINKTHFKYRIIHKLNFTAFLRRTSKIRGGDNIGY